MASTGPGPGFVGIRAADAEGRITGLIPAGSSFLVIRLPALDGRTLEKLPDALLEARAELERLYVGGKKEAEARLQKLLESDPRLAFLGAEKAARRAVRIAEKVSEWAVDRTPMGLARKLWPDVEDIAAELLDGRVSKP